MNRKNINTGQFRVRKIQFRSTYLLFLLGLIAIIALPLIFQNRYGLNLLMIISATGISSLGLTVLLGYTGQFSMAQAVFYGIGAYAVALGTTRLGISWWTALVMGIAIAVVMGIFFGMTTLKVGGHYLTVITICVQIIFAMVLTNWKAVTGGPDGVVGIKRPVVFVSLTEGKSYAWFSLAFLLLAATVVGILKNRPLGRAMRAVRENAMAAEVLGINTLRIQVIAFVLCAILGSVGGAIYAAGALYISPDTFAFDRSATFLIITLMGGSESPIGTALSAGLITMLPEWLRSIQQIYFVVYGFIIIFIIVVMPDGLMGFTKFLVSRFTKAKRMEATAAELQINIPEEEHVLTVMNLGKHFGGIKAIDGIDFVVKRGEVHALIGPNGSGKSTSINVISGIYDATFGKIEFLGKDLKNLRPSTIAHLGLRRTFQNLRLFSNLTVWENVLTGANEGGGTKEEIHNRAVAAISFVNLGEQAYVLCKNLSYGHQKLVELARALAGGPKLLLLDEPAAGMNQSEKLELVELIKKLHSLGLTMVLVEHDMSLVSQVSTQATVLNFGKKIAGGSMETVLCDPVVVEAYLGSEEDDVSA